MNVDDFKAIVHVRLLHWVLLFFGVMTAGLWGIAFPGLGKLSVLENNLKNVKAQVLETERALNESKDLDQLLAEDGKHLEELQARTLEPRERVKVISLLTQVTGDLGIAISDIKPMVQEKKEAEIQEESNKRLGPVFYQLKMASSYQTLGTFFERLATAPLILSVREMQVESQTTKTGLLNVQMVIAAYEKRP